VELALRARVVEVAKAAPLRERVKTLRIHSPRRATRNYHQQEQ
jgi:hypothetical protein